MRNQTQRQDASPQLSFKGVWHAASATPTTPIAALVVDSDRDLVATTSTTENVALWHIGGGRRTTLPDTRGARLALSPLGALLATTTPGCPIQVWSIPDGALFQTCVLSPAHRGNGADGTEETDKTDEVVTALAWHPTYAALYLGTQKGRIYTWRLGQSFEIQEVDISHLTMPDAAITALLVSPQGNWLAVGRDDGVLGLATFETPPHQLLYPGHHQHGVGAFHAGRGFFLISQSLNEPICRLWEPGGISPWVREWRLADAMTSSELYPFVVDPLERWSFSAGALGSIQPWRHWRWPPEDRLPMVIPPGVSPDDRSASVTALATDARGNLLIAADSAGRIWFWDVRAIAATD